MPRPRLSRAAVILALHSRVFGHLLVVLAIVLLHHHLLHVVLFLDVVVVVVFVVAVAVAVRRRRTRAEERAGLTLTCPALSKSQLLLLLLLRPCLTSRLGAITRLIAPIFRQDGRWWTGAISVPRFRGSLADDHGTV